jgi:hypothetical protein
MEKVAHTGAVTLKHAGRSMLVEPNDDVLATVTGSTPAAAAAALAAAAEAAEPVASSFDGEPTAEAVHVPSVDGGEDEEESLPASPMTMQDGIRAVQQAFTRAATPPRWPMYVRQAKQFLRSAIENFDERKYGFASVVDLLRAAGKEGVLRIERDRHGAVRVFPGGNLEAKVFSSPYVPETGVDGTEDTVVDAPAGEEPDATLSAEPVVDAESVAEPPIVDAVTLLDSDEDEMDPDDAIGNKEGANVSRDVIGAGRKTAGRKRKAAAPRAPRAAKGARTTKPRSRKPSR